MKGDRKAHAFRAPLDAALAFCLSAALTLVARPAFADSVAVSTASGFGRVLFTLDPPAKPVAIAKDGVLTVSFGRKIALSAQEVAHGIETYVSSARTDSDGKTFRFALVQPVRLHTSMSVNKFALDLIPASFAGTVPDLPPPPPPVPSTVDPATLPPLSIRTGAYTNFTRLVFDWRQKVPYAVFPGANRISIRFEALARPDFSVLERIAPPWVKQAGWRVENRGTVIEFDTEGGSGYHDFRDGDHVVLDIMAPKTDASAYNPPDDGKDVKPTATALSGTAAHSGSGISRAQTAAIAAAAQTLNAKPAVAATNPGEKPGSKPDGKADVAEAKGDQPTPDAKSTNAESLAQKLAQTVAVAQGEDAQQTRDGATLTFRDAGAHPAAAFIRGMTAWIVLQGQNGIAPAIDTTHLKTALGDFPTSVDVQSGDGYSVLRIGLKRPEQISARREGQALKVVLAPDPGQTATSIDLVRDDNDPQHVSLVTLLSGASHALTLPDPLIGDTLIVVPGAAGHAMLSDHRYVEFAAIPSAAGLVLTPFVDDLSISVHEARATITRPGGLTLTPPQLPNVGSPSALAQNGNGPCYIDFTAWARPTKGGFLHEERVLRDDAAKHAAEKANPARRMLARLYIANRFSAEALGTVDLVQSTDSSLMTDKQLQTIRAAADFMMGRYRDAHNALAGATFDSDRHAALWRGLTDAALENWDAARTSLMKALPVLKLYPKDWQARARIALAAASTHAGALEAADAALRHLPQGLSGPLLLQAELAWARLDAAEGRYRDAHALFAAVEKGNDPSAAAHATYDDVVAGLAAGAVTRPRAITRLETLRYRWRGDTLEMNTLRKLGGLYFEEKRWRDGLEVLRTATQNFPNRDLARQTQDDMRGAFRSLFLKGAADKMPPVEALALFYDFIDLTPIGAEGDEMIRRMAGRLVNVDLLGPASTLLKYQVDKRLDGVARAQVATRLAMIYLLDHKPKDALAAIRDTRVAGLPDNITHDRLLLEARALAALKQWDEATDLIAVDDAPDTRRLRADIYWESGNWAVAGQKAEELLATRWSDPASLTPDDRHEVMRAAIAYSLAGDETSLERLRDHFSTKMKASSDASAFAVVTQRIDTQGVAFRDVAGKVASLDTLESFMSDFKKNYAMTPVAAN